MDSEQTKEILKKELKISIESDRQIGGQSCGMPHQKIVGIHEDLGVKIEIGYYKSQYKNRELVETIFDLIVDDLIK